MRRKGKGVPGGEDRGIAATLGGGKKERKGVGGQRKKKKEGTFPGFNHNENGRKEQVREKKERKRTGKEKKDKSLGLL